MSKRCTACGQVPSGLIPREHDFCEHCGAPLETAPQPQVTIACYRCGKKFEAPQGTTICADCQQIPIVSPAVEVPALSENSFARAAFWGVVFPIVVRVAYAMMIGDYVSREAKALIGVIAFLAGCVVMALLGLVAWAAGQRTKPSSAAEQAVTLGAGALTSVLLWQVT